MKAPPAPTSDDSMPITPPTAKRAERARAGCAMGLGLRFRNIWVAENATKTANSTLSTLPGKATATCAPTQRPGQDARRQQADDGPAHRAAAVVGAHRRQRGEADRRQRGGHRHLHGVFGRDSPCGEDDGDERHHQHAAADAQQARRETRWRCPAGRARESVGVPAASCSCVVSGPASAGTAAAIVAGRRVAAASGAARGVAGGGAPGPARERGASRKRCLQVPPDRHPEPGFRWARSAWRWVHLTRDDHARQAMFQARAQ